MHLLTLSQAWCIQLENHYQIEPLNVAFASAYLSAPELRVAYFCQPYKMYIFWSLAAPKTCRH